MFWSTRVDNFGKYEEVGSCSHHSKHFFLNMIRFIFCCHVYGSQSSICTSSLTLLVFSLKHAATEPAEEQARVTIGVNYEGTKQVCDILFPLIRTGGR